MGALLLILLAAPPCYQPKDVTAGWKQVALPEEAPFLAATGKVEQFRSGARVSVTDEHEALFLAGEHPFPGRTVFDFVLGEGGRSLKVEFEHPLRGAKVDVTAWGPGGTRTLLREQRTPGSSLALTWGMNDVRRVFITVHEHLREGPLLRAYRTERWVPGERLSASPAFHLARSLYYLQPEGGPVRLCNEPKAALQVWSGGPPKGTEPVPVSLASAKE